MKRIYSILLAGVALVAVASCVNRGKNAEVLEFEDLEEVVDEDASVVKIYSNAYDGYTNVRQSPSSKSTILGKLRSGNEYVVLLGMEGNWYEVEYYDQIGYVHKDHVGDTPFKPVTVDVDAKWLEGCWTEEGYIYEGGCLFYFIYSNGKFTSVQEYDYGTLYHGRWQLEGDEIVLTSVYVDEGGRQLGLDRGTVERFKINKSARKLGRMTKRKLVARDPDTYTEDPSMMYKDGFDFLKKEANKYVKSITRKIITPPTSQEAESDYIDRDSDSYDDDEDRDKKKRRSEDWDELLETYEEYVDEYIVLAKKAAKGNVLALAKYPSLMQKAEDLSDELEDAEDDMSSSQLARFNKISMKLLKALEEFDD